MEQTLGKRIMAHRKRMELTQEQLAEQLGITAQAVSKWENDQSCPDIAMLPRLADIFGVTTDQLLGRNAPEPILEGEPVTEEADGGKNNFEFRWAASRKSSLLFAFLVLLVGVLTFLSRHLGWGTSFGQILWPSILLVYGLSELFPRFSVFHMVLVIFGGYSLGANLNIWHLVIDRQLVFPACVILFGLCLLADALRKPKKSHFVLHHKNGKNPSAHWECCCKGEHFECTLSGGNQHYQPEVDYLASGEIEVNTGNLTVDLSGCRHFRENCLLNVECNLSNLVLQVPRQVRVVHSADTSFGNVVLSGQPDADAQHTIFLEADVNSSHLQIEYI